MVPKVKSAPKKTAKVSKKDIEKEEKENEVISEQEKGTEATTDEESSDEETVDEDEMSEDASSQDEVSTGTSAAEKKVAKPGKGATNATFVVNPVSTHSILVTAISSSSDKKGISVSGIRKYFRENHPDKEWDKSKTFVRKALAKGLESGVFIRPKGSENAVGLAGRYKMNKELVMKKGGATAAAAELKKSSKKVSKSEGARKKATKTPPKKPGKKTEKQNVAMGKKGKNVEQPKKETTKKAKSEPLPKKGGKSPMRKAKTV